MDAQGSPASQELLAAMRRFHADGVTVEPLALAASAWDARPPGETIDGDDLAELGEAWRLASLAAARPSAFSTERLVWRARALSAFLRSGDRNGAAMLMLPSYFDAVRENAPTSEVLAILESMRLIAVDSGPIPKDEILSTCYEKEGHYHTLAAEALSVADLDGREASFSRATMCYDLAFEAESSARRRSKIRAAKTTTAYLAATDAGQQETAQAELGKIIAEIEQLQIAAGDVARIGLENITRMAQGRRDLLPYEIT